MPPQPIFKSSRSQSVAVAAFTAMILLGSTGLAYLQAGSKQPTANQSHSPATPKSRELRLNYPKDWQRTQDASNATVMTDPARPARQLRVINLQNSQQIDPQVMIERCIQTQLDAATQETLRQQQPRIVFSSEEFGFKGAEYLGISFEDNGTEPPTAIDQHLLACLSNDGVSYWLLYIRDTTSADEDIEQSFKDNATLLRLMYRSARFADE